MPLGVSPAASCTGTSRLCLQQSLADQILAGMFYNFGVYVRIYIYIGGLSVSCFCRQNLTD